MRDEFEAPGPGPRWRPRGCQSDVEAQTVDISTGRMLLRQILAASGRSQAAEWQPAPADPPASPRSVSSGGSPGLADGAGAAAAAPPAAEARAYPSCDSPSGLHAGIVACGTAAAAQKYPTDQPNGRSFMGKASTQRQAGAVAACASEPTQPAARRASDDHPELVSFVAGPAGAADLSSKQNADLPTNPGSLGHPELCSNICIFYTRGACENGSNCGFCHAHKGRRKWTMDRSSRELLRSLHYLEAYRLMLPIALTKLNSLGTSIDAELVPTVEGRVRWTSETDVSDCRKLSAALSKLDLRPLLTQMGRIMPEGTPESCNVTALLTEVNKRRGM